MPDALKKNIVMRIDAFPIQRGTINHTGVRRRKGSGIGAKNALNDIFFYQRIKVKRETVTSICLIFDFRIFGSRCSFGQAGNGAASAVKDGFQII